MTQKMIGKVSHFYDRAMAADLELEEMLAVGDRIKFLDHEREFEETVESLEVNRHQVDTAKPGEDASVKTHEKIHENAKVYKILEE